MTNQAEKEPKVTFDVALIENSLTIIPKTKAALAKLKKKFKEVPDMGTKEGYADGVAGIKELRTLRVDVGKERESVNKPILAFQRKMKADADSIISELSALEEPIKVAKQKIDDKEALEKEERLRKLRLKVQEIVNIPIIMKGKPLDEISKAIENLTNLNCSDGYYDLTREAIDARVASLALLGELYTEEAEKIRKQNEINRLEREAQIEGRINKLKQMPLEFMSSSSLDINKRIGALEAHTPDASEFDGRYDEMLKAKDEVIANLRTILDAALLREETAAKVVPEPEEVAVAEVIKDAVTVGVGFTQGGVHVPVEEVYAEPETPNIDTAVTDTFENDQEQQIQHDFIDQPVIGVDMAAGKDETVIFEAKPLAVLITEWCQSNKVSDEETAKLIGLLSDHDVNVFGL